MTLVEAWEYITSPLLDFPKTPFSLEEAEIIMKIRALRNGWSDRSAWDAGYKNGWDSCFDAFADELREAMPGDESDSFIDKFYKEYIE